MKKQKNRRLKICGQFRDYGQVPQLRLSGKWMERLGFNVGDQVNITMRNQLLIIEPIQEVATTESKPKPKNDYEPLLRKIDEAMKRLAR